MTYPDDLRYSKEHEWVRVDGERGDVGITDYAQEQLGDIVFVELPAVGARPSSDARPFGVIESVKAVSDLYAPVSGEVIEVNEALARRARARQRGLLRRGLDARRSSCRDPAELDALMDAAAYAERDRLRRGHPMRYSPHTEADRAAMLDAIGVGSRRRPVRATFRPRVRGARARRAAAAHRAGGPRASSRALAARNRIAGGRVFLGAGAYRAPHPVGGAT